VEVELVNGEHWLQSCDDDLLAAGENSAMLGSELIQFGEAVPVGPGRFRLSRLLRGRRGTEWAMTEHAVGERFVLIDPQSLQRIDISSGQAGATVSATPRGLSDTPAQSVSLVVAGEAMRPPSPVHLRAAIDAGGVLRCSWRRRSGLGWGWQDGVEAPLGASKELYRLRIVGTAAAIEAESTLPEAEFSAAEIADLGAGPVGLSVVQVGDLAVSRPATLTIS
jgi:hypothetical protein